MICHVAYATVAYSVTDLGPGYPSLYSRVPLDLGTGWKLLGNGINASGHVAGTATRFNSTYAFLYDGSFHLLGTLGGTYSEGNGINDNDWVTGQSSTAVVVEATPFYTTAQCTTSELLVARAAPAVGINTTGQVAGYSYTTADAGLHAFLYDGSMHDLGTLGGRTSLARSINSQGDVAGTAFLDDYTYHAFLFTSAGEWWILTH